MTYEIEITEACKKALSKLGLEIRKRFDKRILKLADDPKQGKPLRNELHGYWELYFEKSFRILYTIDNGQNKVSVKVILHKDEF